MLALSVVIGVLRGGAIRAAVGGGIAAGGHVCVHTFFPLYLRGLALRQKIGTDLKTTDILKL